MIPVVLRRAHLHPILNFLITSCDVSLLPKVQQSRIRMSERVCDSISRSITVRPRLVVRHRNFLVYRGKEKMLNLCRGRGIHKQVLRVRGVYDAMDDMHEGMQYCAAMGPHAHQDCRSVAVLVFGFLVGSLVGQRPGSQP